MGNTRKIGDIGSVVYDVSGYLYYNSDTSTWYVVYDSSISSSGSGGISQAYVDGSIVAAINAVDSSLVIYIDAYNIIQDTSHYLDFNQLEASIVRIDASLGLGSISSLNDITDVSVGGAAINQVLTYNGSLWIAQDISTAGSGTTYAYVDGSLATRDASISYNLNQVNQLDSSIIRIDAYNIIQDTSHYIDFNQLEASIIRIDASLGLGGSGVSQAYVDGSLAARDASISYNLIYIGEVSTNAGGTEYTSNLFINDGDNHETSLSNLDQIMGLIAPAKPDLLTGQSLTTAGTTTYSAILPSGLSSSWYIDASPGDTITNYVVDDIFTLTTPAYTSDPPTFRAGLYQDVNTSGTISALVNNASVAAYDLSNGVGDVSISVSDASGLIRCSSIGGYGGAESNFWRKAQAYIDITNQKEGFVNYAISHTEALTSSISSFTNDDVATAPSFLVDPSAIVLSDASIHLSGIAHYGSGTTFTTTYVADAGIFRKAYHASNVGRLTSSYGSAVTSNPGATPDVDASFNVSTTFTFNTANQSSGSSNATITATIYKPNTNSAQAITLPRRANTYSTTRATTTVEYFTDESRRLLDASSGSDTSWDSTSYTIFNPDDASHAQVQNGTLRYPVSADYGGFGFTGDKYYIRRFTKAAASSGALTFSGFNPSSNLSPYGSGDVNMIIFLSDQGLYFDLGREFGIGGGDGSSIDQGISAYTSLSSTAINWSLGVYSTGNEPTHTGTYVLIIIFRNTNRTMTQITAS